MKTWIHFIGKSYYTETSFKKEAKEYGVTRRVSPKTLGQMAYGDRVMLAINDGKSAVMFGYFHVETISGLSLQACQSIGSSHQLVRVSTGGRTVSRGCGSYTEGETYAFSVGSRMTLGEIAEETKGMGSQLMVGGEFHDMKRSRMKSMRFAMGFRPFNYTNFLRQVAYATAPGRWAHGSLVAVKGQFYVSDTIEGMADDGDQKVDYTLVEKRLQIVVGYAKK